MKLERGDCGVVNLDRIEALVIQEKYGQYNVVACGQREYVMYTCDNREEARKKLGAITYRWISTEGSR